MNNLLKYWKDKLQLNDWVIKVIDNCPVNQFQIQNAQGETEWDSVNKCAVVRIISESEYGKRILPFIKEKVLIHELLHIKFCLLWESNNDTQNLLLHQYIDELANALYNVRKEEQ